MTLILFMLLAIIEGVLLSELRQSLGRVRGVQMTHYGRRVAVRVLIARVV